MRLRAWGGDEFGIIQAAVEQPSDVAYLAARIQEAFKEQYDIAGHRLIVEASIGIAMSPDNGVEAEQLLKNADMAMYQAKANGRGTFCFFEREMDARVKARSALEFELRQAIMCNQFELYYQPTVNLQNGSDHRLRSAFALESSRPRPNHARGVHPDR